MKTDIKETENGYELMVDMPGFEKKDINLSLNNGYLTVEAKREEKEENDNFVRRERNFSCSRSFYVGEEVTEEDIKAKYNNGTLSLAVPKEDKKVLPRKNIEIE
jgi:HSP20 family molecular chaperone IbpA